MEAYCVKCKAKQQMKDPTETTMKNGKPATTGTCSVCGTKMFKIGGSGGQSAAAGTNKK
jgi:RNase P subunit RPR2